MYKLFNKTSYRYIDTYQLNDIQLGHEEVYVSSGTTENGDILRNFKMLTKMHGKEVIKVFMENSRGQEFIYVLPFETSHQKSKAIAFIMKFYDGEEVCKKKPSEYEEKDFQKVLKSKRPAILRSYFYNTDALYRNTSHKLRERIQRRDEILVILQPHYEAIRYNEKYKPVGFMTVPLKQSPLDALTVHELEHELQELNTMISRAEYSWSNTRTELYMERRKFHHLSEIPEEKEETYQAYKIESRTDDDIYILASTLRGGDTLWLSVYNTKTAEEWTTCDCDKIEAFLDKAIAGDYHMIAHDSDSLLVRALYADIPVPKLENEIQVKTEYKRAKNKALRIQSLSEFGRFAKHLESTCFRFMRVSVRHDEKLNNLQRLQMMKYMFDKHIHERLSCLKEGDLNAIIGVEGDSFRISRVIPKAFVTDVAPKDIEFEYKVPFSVSPRTITFLTSWKEPSIQIEEGKVATCGVGGTGGLLYLSDQYVTQKGHGLLHLDFESYYPNLMLNHPKLMESWFDIKKYRTLLELKQSIDETLKSVDSSMRETYLLTRQVIKDVLNYTHGLLNCEYVEELYNPRIYKHYVRLGHLYMLELIRLLKADLHCQVVAVQTDGVYVDVCDTNYVPGNIIEKFKEYGFNIKVSKYAGGLCRGVNMVLVSEGTNKITTKGAYANHCEEVLNLVRSYILYGDEWLDKHEKSHEWRAYMLYSPQKNARLIKFKGDYLVDERGAGYLIENGYGVEDITYDEYVKIAKNALGLI